MTSPALVVLYEITQDNLDGSPWPPCGRDHWSIVKRERGHTTWRRFAFTNQTTRRDDANAGLDQARRKT
jgi:hypothetical protein